MDLKDHIRGILDFPKPGILFYDISTLLRDADAWQVAMGRLARVVLPYQPDLIAGIESRGFLMAAPLADCRVTVAPTITAWVGSRTIPVIVWVDCAHTAPSVARRNSNGAQGRIEKWTVFSLKEGF